MLTSRPRYKRHQSGGINSSLPVKPSDAIQNSISRAALFPTVQCSAWRAPWGATFEQGGHQQQGSLMTCVSSCMGHTECLNPPPPAQTTYVCPSFTRSTWSDGASFPPSWVAFMLYVSVSLRFNFLWVLFRLRWNQSQPVLQCSELSPSHPRALGVIAPI